jgi:hypothetical protein
LIASRHHLHLVARAQAVLSHQRRGHERVGRRRQVAVLRLPHEAALAAGAEPSRDRRVGDGDDGLAVELLRVRLAPAAAVTLPVALPVAAAPVSIATVTAVEATALLLAAGAAVLTIEALIAARLIAALEALRLLLRRRLRRRLLLAARLVGTRFGTRLSDRRRFLRRGVGTRSAVVARATSAPSASGAPLAGTVLRRGAEVGRAPDVDVGIAAEAERLRPLCALRLGRRARRRRLDGRRGRRSGCR